jgi:hypothetical protein
MECEREPLLPDTVTA